MHICSIGECMIELSNMNDNFFRQSMAINESKDPFSKSIKSYNIKEKVKNSEKIAFKHINKREFITVTAEKS